jgi:hypothetical protein
MISRENKVLLGSDKLNEFIWGFGRYDAELHYTTDLFIEIPKASLGDFSDLDTDTLISLRVAVHPPTAEAVLIALNLAQVGPELQPFGSFDEVEKFYTVSAALLAEADNSSMRVDVLLLTGK